MASLSSVAATIGTLSLAFALAACGKGEKEANLATLDGVVARLEGASAKDSVRSQRR